MWWFNYRPETSAAHRCSVLLSGFSSVDPVGRISKSNLEGRTTSLIISWDSWLYQIWFGQSGVTNIPTVLSFHIFCIILGYAYERWESIKFQTCPWLCEWIHSNSFRIWPVWHKLFKLSINAWCKEVNCCCWNKSQLSQQQI